VVKQALDRPGEVPINFANEDGILDLLSQTDSTHWTKRIVASDKLRGDEYPDEDYAGFITRIYLEYCELGSVADLLWYRHSE